MVNNIYIATQIIILTARVERVIYFMKLTVLFVWEAFVVQGPHTFGRQCSLADTVEQFSCSRVASQLKRCEHPHGLTGRETIDTLAYRITRYC